MTWLEVVVLMREAAAGEISTPWTFYVSIGLEVLIAVAGIAYVWRRFG